MNDNLIKIRFDGAFHKKVQLIRMTSKIRICLKISSYEPLMHPEFMNGFPLPHPPFPRAVQRPLADASRPLQLCAVRRRARALFSMSNFRSRTREPPSSTPPKVSISIPSLPPPSPSPSLFPGHRFRWPARCERPPRGRSASRFVYAATTAGASRPEVANITSGPSYEHNNLWFFTHQRCNRTTHQSAALILSTSY